MKLKLSADKLISTHDVERIEFENAEPFDYRIEIFQSSASGQYYVKVWIREFIRVLAPFKNCEDHSDVADEVACVLDDDGRWNSISADSEKEALDKTLLTMEAKFGG